MKPLNLSIKQYLFDHPLEARIWGWSFLIKFILILLIPLAPDEAYYWVWSHFLSWSYYDHPPMVGWMFRLSQVLPGGLARLPFLIASQVAILFFVVSLSSFLPKKSHLLFFSVLLLSPLVGIGSVVGTPDSPLLLFWALSFWLFLKALESPEVKWYLLFGAALGLGFCSKYMIVLFVPCVGLSLLDRNVRLKVRWKWVPLTLLTGFIFSLPVIYWNYRNEWLSFKFQLEHGLGATEWKPRWTTSYLLEQFLLVFPVFWILALHQRLREQAKLLLSFAFFPFLFFFYSTFKGRVEANWPVMAYPYLYVLAIAPFQQVKWIRATIYLWAVALLIVTSDIVVAWSPFKPTDAVFYKHRLYKPILAEMDEGLDLPVFLSTYQMASIISFEQKKIYFKLPKMNRFDFFDYLNQPESLPSRFYLYREPQHVLPEIYKQLGYHIAEESSVGPFQKLKVTK